MTAFQVDDRVFFDYGYGRIKATKKYFRNGVEDILYTVRYYDTFTGHLKKCPDQRCGAHKDLEDPGCAICGRNLWADQLRPMNENDLKFFIESGFLKESP
jgi:hypothetical protein